MPCLLDALPTEAVEHIARHVSTPMVPSACLLPLVCRDWRAAVGRAVEEEELDITLSISFPNGDDRVAPAPLAHMQRATRSHTAAAYAIPLRRGKQLAAWLARHRASSVRSLCILQPTGVDLDFVRTTLDQDLTEISQELAARHQQCQRESSTSSVQAVGQQQQRWRQRQQHPRRFRPVANPAPGLVNLEVHIVGMSCIKGFLDVVRGCPSLQHLTLKPAVEGLHGWDLLFLDVTKVAEAVAPLKQLRTLYIQSAWNTVAMLGHEMGAVLRQLPPSLEEVQLVGWRAIDPVNISWVTHLVKLRLWEYLFVGQVVDDISIINAGGAAGVVAEVVAAGQGGGQEGHAGGGAHGAPHGTSSWATALTALTRLWTVHELTANDARLQLPNLQSVQLGYGAEPGAWQQLAGMQQLQQLAIEPCWRHGGRGMPTADMLSTFTQLQGLELHRCCLQLSGAAAVAAAVACLTQLTSLHVPWELVCEGSHALLGPLTQLRELTVCCCMTSDFGSGLKPSAVAPAMVSRLAAAMAGSQVPQQRLVLLVPDWITFWPPAVQQAGDAARAAFPGLQVEVVCRVGGA